MKIPLDIFIIVDELFQSDDRQALQELCRTCTALVPFCQRKLFHSIFFDGSDNNERHLATLDEVLTRSPHIADYVRILDYSVERRELTPWTNSPATLTNNVLLNLHNVQTLHLHLIASSFDWRDIRPTLALAINHILSSPSLTRLHLHRMRHVPPAFLQAASNLLELEFENVEIDIAPSEDIKPESPPHLPPIPRLSSYYCVGIPVAQPTEALLGIDDHTPMVDFSHLKRLNIEWYNVHDVSATDRLMRIPLSLESFQFTVFQPVAFSGLSSMILARSFRTLKRLEIKYALGDEVQLLHEGEPYLELCAELQPLSQRNRLEYLHIEFEFNRYPDDWSDQLGKLDDVLTKIAFPCLKQVHLSLGIWSNVEFLRRTAYRSIGDIERRCQAQFPKLSSMEGLNFNCYVTN